MSHILQEIYTSNKKAKAVITKRSEKVLSVQVFVLNEGFIQGHGHVHEPVWESTTSRVLADSLERAIELAHEELKRFSQA